MDNVLEIKNLTIDFGGVKALDRVSLEIKKNQIVALIGPNGAGKTTLFNCLTGIYTPQAGDIIVYPREGKPRRVNGMKINQITKLGLARTFQNIRLFEGMTVLENVMIGRHSCTKAGIAGAIFRPQSTRKEEKDIVNHSYQILKYIGLDAYVNELAGNLPYGACRRLEIARALACDPQLLLLDEPAAGMNHQETRELEELIVRLWKERNLSVLLIEHDMKLVMNLAQNIFVLDYGEVIARGTPEEIASNPVVVEAYLGVQNDAQVN